MKPNFGFFIVALCVGLMPEYGALARSKHCDNGEFFMTSVCRDCPAGCYCPYISGDRMQLDIANEIKNSQLENWCAHKINQCDKPKQKNKYYNEYQDCGRNDAAQVWRCPDNFPNSAARSISIESCYTTINSRKLYYKKTTCISGEYLPINSDTCIPCKTGPSDYCPGLKNTYPSTTSDQGIETCAPGQFANSAHTACEKQANQPTESEEDTLITVLAGNYLPANQTTPQPCTNVSRKQYCPGGEFYKSSTRQGIYDCPYTTSDDHAKCTLTLTMEQMQYGISGGKSGNTGTPCWKETDPQNYKNCVLSKN